MSLKQKDFSFDIKLLSNDDGDSSCKFEGFASTYNNVDLVNDIVMPGAFEKSLSRRKPKLLLQHDFTQPIGVITETQETSKGLYIKGKLLKGIKAADETSILMKNGVIDSMSIGYNVLDSERTSEGNLLKEIDLHEVSLVTFPANPMAVVTSVKNVVPFKDLPILMKDGAPDTSHSWDSDEAIKNIKKFTDSEDSPSTTYRNAFLYVSGDGSSFGDYKLPVADVIDGSLKLIPRAIFSAAAAVGGARGGLDVSSEDKNKIVSSINKYYSKMGMDTPFNKSGNIIINSHQARLINNKREFEKLLRDSGCFSKSAATILAANWTDLGEPDRSVKEKQANLLSINLNDIQALIDSVLN